MAKNSLERYTHYYERWASNQTVCTFLYFLCLRRFCSSSSFIFFLLHYFCVIWQSRQKAMTDLQQLQTHNVRTVMLLRTLLLL